MKILYRCQLALLTFLLVACSVPITTPAPLGTIRFALSDEFSTRDIPYLMALDLLEDEGYTIQRTAFAEGELSLEALARGDADIASSGIAIGWSAIAQGANIRSIVSRGKYTYGIVAGKDIQTCADLDGASFAIRTTTGTNPALIRQYIEDNCPGITLNYVVIGSTNTRKAAILAGEIDATLLEPDDFLDVEKQAPGQFHTLVNFGDEFPGLFFNVVNVSKAWGEQNPELVQAFIRALLVSIRSINGDPKILPAQLEGRLSYTVEDAEKTSSLFLNPTTWDNTGSMTTETVQFNIDFLVAAEAIPPGLTVEDLVDLSYLNAVLDDIGRQ